MENELVETIAEQVAPVETPVEQKLLPQERVNDIVKRARMEEREKAQREYGAELERLKAGQQPVAQEQAAAPAGEEDIIGRQIEERLIRMAQEHKLKVEQEAEAARLQQIANTYFQKMAEGPELFEDFEEVMKDFNAAKNADVIELAHEFDNMPQVMYELAKNRTKAAELRRLARDDKEDALYELQRLAKSIAYNEQAQQEYVPPKPPLTKPKPSRVGTENGPLTLKELKSASWLKG